MADSASGARRTRRPAAIEAALRELLEERHARGRVYVPARVLNLVAVVDRDWRGEIENRLERVGRYHPSRTIVCSVEPGRDDARRAARSCRPPTRAEAGRARDRLARRSWSTCGPAAPDAARHDRRPARRAPTSPTVVWSPHRHPEAVDAAAAAGAGRADRLGRRARRRRRASRAPSELRAGRVRRRPRVAALDAVARADRRDVRPAAVARASCGEHQRGDGPPPPRLGDARRCCCSAGWRRGSAGSRARSCPQNGVAARRARTARRQEVELRLEPEPRQAAPGLAGAHARDGVGHALSLDRGPGGLARQARGTRDGQRVATGPCSAPRAARPGSSARGSARRCCATRPTRPRSRRRRAMVAVTRRAS